MIRTASLARQALQKLRTRPGRSAGQPLVQWLRFANAGMFEEGNLYCFELAIDALPSSAGAVVEIGSFCGLSTNLLTYLLRQAGRPNLLYSCDRWNFEGAAAGALIEAGSPVTYDHYRTLVRDSFLRNVRTFSPDRLPHTLELYSDEFFAAWSARQAPLDVFGQPSPLGGPIGFAYIDGNHTYEFARRDFDHCDQWLEPGGHILFDDSAPGSGWEVCRVVKEALQTNRYECIIRNPNALIRKKG